MPVHGWFLVACGAFVAIHIVRRLSGAGLHSWLGRCEILAGFGFSAGFFCFVVFEPSTSVPLRWFVGVLVLLSVVIDIKALTADAPNRCVPR